MHRDDALVSNIDALVGVRRSFVLRVLGAGGHLRAHCKYNPDVGPKKILVMQIMSFPLTLLHFTTWVEDSKLYQQLGNFGVFTKPRRSATSCRST